jgi:hypothetical protein
MTDNTDDTDVTENADVRELLPEKRAYTLTEASKLLHISIAQIHRMVDCKAVKSICLSVPGTRKKQMKRIPYSEMCRLVSEGLASAT